MSGDKADGGPPPGRGVGRRSVLRGLGAGVLAAGAGGLVAACSSGAKEPGSSASASTITLGFITPLTGSLAGFASGDKFVLDTVRATSAYAKGFKTGGKTYTVNVVVGDSRSDPNRASQLARQLILNNNVDMLLATSTPETTSPVAVVAQT
jgi:branched-chain amino acid transport system substrate-binding protein